MLRRFARIVKYYGFGNAGEQHCIVLQIVMAFCYTTTEHVDLIRYGSENEATEAWR